MRPDRLARVIEVDDEVDLASVFATIPDVLLWVRVAPRRYREATVREVAMYLDEHKSGVDSTDDE